MEIQAPKTEQALLQRVVSLAGLTLTEAAQQVGLIVPNDLRTMKGWVGQLLERCLGCDAGTAPEPDFSHLGIELKTIPVDAAGKPLESTYVSIVPLYNHQGINWHNSDVKAKLMRVLWVPIEGEAHIPLPLRRIGCGIFWSPNREQMKILQSDWEELMDYVIMGQVEQIDARMGRYMQIRPKAANAKALTWGVAPDGSKIQTLPRGFYLRTCFTKQIIAHYL